MSKKDNIKRFFPNLFKPYTNTYIKGLLETFGDSDDRAVEQIENAKEQIFISTAQGSFLDTLGSNVGVQRPLGPVRFFIDD